VPARHRTANEIFTHSVANASRALCTLPITPTAPPALRFTITHNDTPQERANNPSHRDATVALLLGQILAFSTNTVPLRAAHTEHGAASKRRPNFSCSISYAREILIASNRGSFFKVVNRKQDQRNSLQLTRKLQCNFIKVLQLLAQTTYHGPHWRRPPTCIAELQH